MGREQERDPRERQRSWRTVRIILERVALSFAGGRAGLSEPSWVIDALDLRLDRRRSGPDPARLESASIVTRIVSSASGPGKGQAIECASKGERLGAVPLVLAASAQHASATGVPQLQPPEVVEHR